MNIIIDAAFATISAAKAAQLQYAMTLPSVSPNSRTMNS